MSNDQDAQSQVAQLFEALNRRELERCDQLLAALALEPSYSDWVELGRAIRDVMSDHDWGKAERTLRMLLARELANDVRGKASVALGKIYFQLGNWQRAIEFSEAALPFYAHDIVEQARILQNIAVMYRRDFNHADAGVDSLRAAERYARRAHSLLATIEAPSDTVRQVQGLVWNTLGTIYMNQRQWAAALACYQSKQMICQERRDQQGMAEVTKNIGELYQLQGEWQRAITHYCEPLRYFQSVNNLMELIDTHANLATLYQELGNRATALTHYDAALQHADQQRRLISNSEAATNFAATVAEIYDNAILFCIEEQLDAQAFAYTEQARARALLNQLATNRLREGNAAATAPTHSPNFHVQPSTLTEVQALLPQCTVLILYYTTGLYADPTARVAAKTSLFRHRFPREATLAFVVTAEHCHVYALDLPPNYLLRHQIDGLALTHLRDKAWSQKLYAKLLAPIIQHIEVCRHVIIVPHGPLHHVPFHGLGEPEQNLFTLPDGPTVSYALSASILRQLHVLRPHAAKPPKPCLALGHNGKTTDCPDQSTQRSTFDHAPLYFAEAEAHAVATATGGDCWSGATLQKTALFAHARDYRILHFACHGQFNSEDPMASHLMLGPNTLLDAEEIVHHLDLACDLVTLSACDSGTSLVTRGDEVFGLVRAFLVAGASTLLITRWPVDDLATYLFMQEFYRLLLDGDSPATACKHAQRYLRTLPRHQLKTITEQLDIAWQIDWAAARFDYLGDGDAHALPYVEPRYWAAFVILGGLPSSNLTHGSPESQP